MPAEKLHTNPLSTLPLAKEIGKVQIQMTDFHGSGKRAMQITVHPGGSWSKDLKASDGTDSCQKAHLGVVRSGRLGIRMDDGEEVTIGRDEVFYVPPGHDAWCVGEEKVVFLEFSG